MLTMPTSLHLARVRPPLPRSWGCPRPEGAGQSHPPSCRSMPSICRVLESPCTLVSRCTNCVDKERKEFSENDLYVRLFYAVPPLVLTVFHSTIPLNQSQLNLCAFALINSLIYRISIHYHATSPSSFILKPVYFLILLYSHILLCTIYTCVVRLNKSVIK